MYEFIAEEQAALLMASDGGTILEAIWEEPEPIDADDPPPATEQEFIQEVDEILPPSAGAISDSDLSLVAPAEWDEFLAALLGFAATPVGTTGADQNSYWYDSSDAAPLGEWFVEAWGWLPSVQQMPGFDFYDYLDIDPEFLEMAYGAHLGENLFRDAGVSLATVANMPFQVYVQGVPLSIVWHSGAAPVSNLTQVPGQPGDIVVTASSGYFTVHADPVGPVPSTGESPPTAINLIVMNEANAPYIKFLDQALQYLIKDPLALQVLLEAYRLGIHITIVTGDEAETRFKIATNTVEWNPGLGLRLSNGGIMSPAMALLHEIAHRVVNVFGNDAQYDTLEERAIITNYEQVIGQRLGEPTRQNHQGNFVLVPSVTFHSPATSF